MRRFFHEKIMVGESTESKDALEFTVMGIGDQYPAAFFEKLVKDSPLSPNLKNARIIQNKGCSCCNYISLSKPYSGNVLAIDDSSGHIEVINQGALMCGHFNQFEVPKNFWTDVLKHDEEIRIDRPALYDKMAAIRTYKEQGKF